MASTTLATDDAAIRECIDTSARAIRAKDINALMACYAPEVAVFDLMPLQTEGTVAYRKNFEGWFASVQGPIDYEIRDLHITMRADAGLCHYIGRVKVTRTRGQKVDYQVRVTAGVRKIKGRWLMVHEHISVPFPDREAMQEALASTRG